MDYLWEKHLEINLECCLFFNAFSIPDFEDIIVKQSFSTINCKKLVKYLHVAHIDTNQKYK